MAKSKLKVEAECYDCGGTGVYCGMAEPKGVGVVCLSCNGSGKIMISYNPFNGRKKRADVKVVRLSRGSFIPLGCGPTGGQITYEEFVAGKMPKQ